MADTGQLATQERRSIPTEDHTEVAAAPPDTSVANPRRIRLTRLSQDAPRTR
jgi:hypothetical protein